MIIYLDYFVDSIGSEFSDLLLSTAIRNFFLKYIFGMFGIGIWKLECNDASDMWGN